MSNNYLILRKPAELETITKLKEKLFSEQRAGMQNLLDAKSREIEGCDIIQR